MEKTKDGHEEDNEIEDDNNDGSIENNSSCFSISFLTFNVVNGMCYNFSAHKYLFMYNFISFIFILNVYDCMLTY